MQINILRRQKLRKHLILLMLIGGEGGIRTRRMPRRYWLSKGGCDKAANRTTPATPRSRSGRRLRARQPLLPPLGIDPSTRRVRQARHRLSHGRLRR